MGLKKNQRPGGSVHVERTWRVSVATLRSPAGAERAISSSRTRLARLFDRNFVPQVGAVKVSLPRVPFTTKDSSDIFATKLNGRILPQYTHAHDRLGLL